MNKQRFVLSKDNLLITIEFTNTLDWKVIDVMDNLLVGKKFNIGWFEDTMKASEHLTNEVEANINKHLQKEFKYA